MINNFNPLALRADIGPMWQNYGVNERLKHNHNRRHHVNKYFWRTYDGAEIDYLEEAGGRFVGFEFKWQPVRWRVPAAFAAAYPGSTVAMVNRENYLDELLV